MNTLKDRFDAEAERQDFSFSEIVGFQSNYKLALIAGMAIGYKMGVQDVQDIIVKTGTAFE